MTYDLNKISASLSECNHFSGDRVFYFPLIDSTNSWMLSRTDIHGTVCLAGKQSSGRGRMGRKWEASEGGAVLMSLGWFLGDASPSGLSLLSGLAVVDALNKCGASGVALKWPNDILVDGRKLGGILVELSGNDCVIGIGINASVPQDCGNRIDQPWVDLDSLGCKIEMGQLASEIVIAHDRLLAEFMRDGFSPFADDWYRQCAHREAAVEYRMGVTASSGMCLGVDGTGALKIDSGGELVHLVSGEVSIRM